MLETCASTTFHDFPRQMEWGQRYFTKMSLKAHILRKYGNYTTHGYLTCSKIWTPYYLNISIQF